MHKTGQHEDQSKNKTQEGREAKNWSLRRRGQSAWCPLRSPHFPSFPPAEASYSHRHMGPTTRARFVHNRRRRRRRGPYAVPDDDDEEEDQQEASSSSSSSDEGEEDAEEEGSGEVDDDEGEAAEPSGKEEEVSPVAAAARSGRKASITISLKKVCKV